MTLLNGRIWQAVDGRAVGYSPATREWDQTFETRPRGDVGMTVNARGLLWASYSVGVQSIDPTTGETVEYEIGTGEAHELPRLAHDPSSGILFYAGIRERRMERFSLSRSRFEDAMEVPLNMGWAMCSDQDGHLYVGDFDDNAALWQYDIRSAAWTPLPRIEVIAAEGDETVGCAISEAGYLFVKSRQHMFRMDLELR